MACLYEDEKGPVGILKGREGVKNGAGPGRKQEARERRVLETV